jgi:hypothetical protein
MISVVSDSRFRPCLVLESFFAFLAFQAALSRSSGAVRARDGSRTHFFKYVTSNDGGRIASVANLGIVLDLDTVLVPFNNNDEFNSSPATLGKLDCKGFARCRVLDTNVLRNIASPNHARGHRSGMLCTQY